MDLQDQSKILFLLLSYDEIEFIYWGMLLKER
jgi:hypothetical protein